MVISRKIIVSVECHNHQTGVFVFLQITDINHAKVDVANAALTYVNLIKIVCFPLPSEIQCAFMKRGIGHNAPPTSLSLTWKSLLFEHIWLSHQGSTSHTEAWNLSHRSGVNLSGFLYYLFIYLFFYFFCSPCELPPWKVSYFNRALTSKVIIS